MRRLCLWSSIRHDWDERFAIDMIPGHEASIVLTLWTQWVEAGGGTGSLLRIQKQTFSVRIHQCVHQTNRSKRPKKNIIIGRHYRHFPRTASVPCCGFSSWRGAVGERMQRTTAKVIEPGGNWEVLPPECSSNGENLTQFAVKYFCAAAGYAE